MQEITMPPKPSWQIRRSGVAQRDGSQRWDDAYQLLLGSAPASASGLAPMPVATSEENPYDGSSALCARLDQSATTAPDDCAADRLPAGAGRDPAQLASP